MGYLSEFEQLGLFSALLIGDVAYGVSTRENVDERTDRVVSSGSIHELAER